MRSDPKQERSRIVSGIEEKLRLPSRQIAVQLFVQKTFSPLP
jgi:hypothetical protein